MPSVQKIITYGKKLNKLTGHHDYIPNTWQGETRKFKANLSFTSCPLQKSKGYDSEMCVRQPIPQMCSRLLAIILKVTTLI